MEKELRIFQIYITQILDSMNVDEEEYADLYNDVREDLTLLSDEQFMRIAEEQGNTYSVEGFCEMFNESEGEAFHSYIRAIYVDKE